VESLVGPLLPLFERERTAGRRMALAVVVHTAGSTYRKPGALMLIAHDGDYAGLLSGGCLETDLREHARAVIETGKPHTVTYDTGGSDDALWGLGVGCEGSMRIFLLRVGPENGWQPIDHFAQALATHSLAAAGIVVESDGAGQPPGTVIVPFATEQARDGIATWIEPAGQGTRMLVISLALPPRMLLLGAGPDAMPIVQMAVHLGWKVTVYDHRPAYAQASYFPGAERVILSRPEELANTINLSSFDAAVVMSHHLVSDLQYLRVLAASPMPYVGLLGPANRREKLLSDMGEDAKALRTRLRAPVGLALGGRSPESIALSIVSEIHAYLHGREGREGGAFSAAMAYQPSPPERQSI
jgi:xanthine dehydrogenase accessory factor